MAIDLRLTKQTRLSALLTPVIVVEPRLGGARLSGFPKGKSRGRQLLFSPPKYYLATGKYCLPPLRGGVLSFVTLARNCVASEHAWCHFLRRHRGSGYLHCQGGAPCRMSRAECGLEAQFTLPAPIRPVDLKSLDLSEWQRHARLSTLRQVSEAVRLAGGRGVAKR
eukprot:3259312-Pleurochrysis_carterae.AAC.1